MRSVFVFLPDAELADVQAYLSRTFPLQPGPPWILDVAGDPALYIYFNTDPNVEAQMMSLGHQAGLTVTADVSGRHPGDAEVRNLVCGLLDEFGGVAHDDYGDHHWTSEEVRSGAQVDGHPFFDYRGWPEQLDRPST